MTGQAFEEERGFLSAVLDTAGALVLVVDRQGRIVRFNRECERVTGYRSEEVTGRHFDMFLVPEERAGVGDVFESLSSGEFPNRHENHWVAKDGTTRLIAWANTALTDPEGRVTHVVGTGIDVTEQRQMENDLRHREQQLRLVMDAVPVLIAYVDADMRYRFANATHREWFGLEPDQMIGRRVKDLMEPDTFETLRPAAERALRGKKTAYEGVFQHSQRGERQVSTVLVPDRGRDGGIIGYFSVMLDITERKHGEEQKRRRLLGAAHADRLSTMGEMSTEIAHELNQPLTAITTTADVLVEEARHLGGGRADMLCEALHDISGQAHRAAAVLKHVRTFARRREPELEPLELEPVIDNALSLIQIDSRGEDVIIDKRLADRLHVEADAVLLEQLMVNLVRNAVEAMTSAETAAPRLTISAAATDGSVEVRIADNGPGLSVEAREHLFEPFYTTKPDGTGLGLAISRSIVEAHGGRLWAETPPQGGTELAFTLNPSTDNNEQETPGDN